jgi:hypothetical protein
VRGGLMSQRESESHRQFGSSRPPSYRHRRCSSNRMCDPAIAAPLENSM